MKNTWNLRGSNAITLQLIQEVRCHHCLVWESTTLGSSPLENWHRSIRMRNFGCGLLCNFPLPSSFHCPQFLHHRFWTEETHPLRCWNCATVRPFRLPRGCTTPLENGCWYKLGDLSQTLWDVGNSGWSYQQNSGPIFNSCISACRTWGETLGCGLYWQWRNLLSWFECVVSIC